MNKIFKTIFLVLLVTIQLSADAKNANPYRKGADDRDYQVRYKQEHRLQMLNHGGHSLLKRIDMIRRAKKYIKLEYFIFNDDIAGRILLSELIKKGKQGVKVQILLDRFLTIKTINPFIAHELRKTYVDVKYYNPVPLVRIGKFQYRNHRKSFIVDGVEAITGGRNIGDEYFDLDREYNFLDRDVYIKGAIIKHIDNSFDDFWNHKASVREERARKPKLRGRRYHNGDFAKRRSLKLDLKKWNKKVKIAQDFIKSTHNYGVVINNFRKITALKYGLRAPIHSCYDIAFFSDYAGIGRRAARSTQTMKYHLFGLFKEAKRSIKLDTPYFILNKFMGSFLDDVLSKDIKVSLLTNGLISTDAIHVQAGFNARIRSWINKGMTPYIFEGKKISKYPVFSREFTKATWGTHSKSFVIDEKIATIGTFNFDPRSANLNTEEGIVCYNGPAFARQLSENIAKRSRHALKIESVKQFNKAKFNRVSLKKKLLYFLSFLPSNLAAPLL